MSKQIVAIGCMLLTVCCGHLPGQQTQELSKEEVEQLKEWWAGLSVEERKRLKEFTREMPPDDDETSGPLAASGAAGVVIGAIVVVLLIGAAARLGAGARHVLDRAKYRRQRWELLDAEAQGDGPKCEGEDAQSGG